MDNKLNNNNGKGNGKNLGALIAVGVSILFYFSLYIINKSIFIKSVNKFWESLTMILPFLFFVFIIMVITLLLFKPDKIKKYLGKKSGIKGMLLTSVAGILSVGPAYLWYPLIADLKEDGMREKLITIFIYNRAIKLQLFPLMIFYFGVKFSVIESLLIFIFSFIIGEIVEIFTVGNN